MALGSGTYEKAVLECRQLSPGRAIVDGSVGASSGDESDSEEDDDEEEEDLDDGCYVFEPGKNLVRESEDDGRGSNEQGH